MFMITRFGAKSEEFLRIAPKRTIFIQAASGSERTRRCSKWNTALANLGRADCHSDNNLPQIDAASEPKVPGAPLHWRGMALAVSVRIGEFLRSCVIAEHALRFSRGRDAAAKLVETAKMARWLRIGPPISAGAPPPGGRVGTPT
jgi:hypothetical protein